MIQFMSRLTSRFRAASATVALRGPSKSGRRFGLYMLHCSEMELVHIIGSVFERRLHVCFARESVV